MFSRDNHTFFITEQGDSHLITTECKLDNANKPNNYTKGTFYIGRVSTDDLDITATPKRVHPHVTRVESKWKLTWSVDILRIQY